MKERLREYDPSSSSQRGKAGNELWSGAEARPGQRCSLHPAQAASVTPSAGEDDSSLRVDAERDERMLHGALSCAGKAYASAP